jgi:hypothetical protein
MVGLGDGRGLELAKAPAPSAEAKATFQFGQPLDFVYMQPHMHLGSKDMKIDVHYPTGEKETQGTTLELNGTVPCIGATGAGAQ